MIRYDLVCHRGDRFEAWFRGSADFDEQTAASAIPCPVCGSDDVTKALMAPALRRSRSTNRRAEEPPGARQDNPAHPPSDQSVTASPHPKLAKAIDEVRRLTREIRAQSEDVGRRFPEEARKIHYAETEPRNIIGQASLIEAEELAEEGIGFHALPVLPEDRN